MDATAQELLAEARSNFSQMQFSRGRIAQIGEGEWIVATGCGTVKSTTLAFALRARGFTVQIYDGFLEVLVSKSTQPLEVVLRELADGCDAKLFADNANLMTEKFHPYLSRRLLEIDALTVRLDEICLPTLSGTILSDSQLVHVT
jgi:ATP-dependent Lhr-like helicase